MKKLPSLGATLIALMLLTACGQKGPLIVEEPTLETPKTQDEELAPTK